MATISERIKELRTEKGYTQEELAKILGLNSKSNIANYENGANSPSDKIKSKMCEVFDCSMDYLMGKVDYRNNINIDIPRLLSEYKNFIKENNFPEADYNLLDADEKILLFNIINAFGNKVNGKDVSARDYYMEQLKTKKHRAIILTIYAIYLKFAQDTFAEIENRYSKEIKEKTNISVEPSNMIKKTTVENSKKYYMCPVYGRIAAGEPNWAEECMEGYLPIDHNLMNIINPEECFFLRVNGESMNKVIKNGAFALIRKTNWVEDGEIAVVLVNGYDATLKKFKRLKKSGFIMLEPQSNSDEFEPIIIDPKETDVKIIGKYIGKMEMN